MADYNCNADGTPTAPHKWEEQFRVKGERSGIPPAEKLVERIAQLKTLMATEKGQASRRLRSWAREVAWRERQLETIRSANGDSEHQG